MSSQVSEVPRRELNPRQAETVERLWEAGLAELREVGHEGLTIRTVAARAGVSPATAYTYLASKAHLFAELFWRHLTTDPVPSPRGASAVERVQSTVRATTERIVAEPALAAAVTPALLGTDRDVARLRLRIGAELVRRFEVALAGPDGRDPVDAALLDALVLAFSGALLQAGMGIGTYEQMADRLAQAAAVILGGRR